MITPYSQAYYAGCTDVSGRSARRVVPHVMRLVAPASVIDFGCGMGTWLRAFADAGVGTILGIDGDHVTPEHMQIEPGHFVARDLARSLDLPDDVPQRFDLAVSLEVAEHLPPKRAAGFVADLAAVAPAVLFSAAVPHQGGAGHVNEQWPEYWAALFAERGFRTVDCIRRLVWDDPDVAYYYAQNTFLFVEPTVLEHHTHLHPFVAEAGDCSLSRIHPRRWLEVNDPKRRSLTETLRGLPWALRNVVAGRREEPPQCPSDHPGSGPVEQ